ncbi:hypothetical protein DERP_008509 [Dermatophagoides pteronyssinus]|uniref:Uncharacterized protein n=1 Tax=Dermatophagoides pteronyssinus TaxID=6956 RepID=A0ABQ8IVH2_DERPT|nr:hypothetical protein DERP_008509 [Dermatophagoides pteronyssinus]
MASLTKLFGCDFISAIRLAVRSKHFAIFDRKRFKHGAADITAFAFELLLLRLHNNFIRCRYE